MSGAQKYYPLSFLLVFDFAATCMPPEKSKKVVIEMKPSKPGVWDCQSTRPATKVYTEPCPAYEVGVHAHASCF